MIESVQASLAGKNVAVATMTSSGKSLCYNLSVLEVLLQNLSACALYHFPTKCGAYLLNLFTHPVYGSDPSFVFCTATSGNPREHAMELANLPTMELIQNDGSPSGQKLFVLWNPSLNPDTVLKTTSSRDTKVSLDKNMGHTRSGDTKSSSEHRLGNSLIPFLLFVIIQANAVDALLKGASCKDRLEQLRTWTCHWD
ncbi:hypothetical protein RHMOL_Rhmol01G0071500 [Rhododendron molle]|uniref:Uncharacterized protein n=1 Tax=Rhododendron molle TaxID=49168 RepID=A0ACC0Q0C9_RHOML|nr:hypothetical protein RHMOL_Rhmol01G0071500 [Rhododendron molle]